MEEEDNADSDEGQGPAGVGSSPQIGPAQASPGVVGVEFQGTNEVGLGPGSIALEAGEPARRETDQVPRRREHIQVHRTSPLALPATRTYTCICKSAGL